MPHNGESLSAEKITALHLRYQQICTKYLQSCQEKHASEQNKLLSCTFELETRDKTPRLTTLQADVCRNVSHCINRIQYFRLRSHWYKTESVSLQGLHYIVNSITLRGRYVMCAIIIDVNFLASVFAVLMSKRRTLHNNCSYFKVTRVCRIQNTCYCERLLSEYMQTRVYFNL